MRSFQRLGNRKISKVSDSMLSVWRIWLTRDTLLSAIQAAANTSPAINPLGPSRTVNIPSTQRNHPSTTSTPTNESRKRAGDLVSDTRKQKTPRTGHISPSTSGVSTPAVSTPSMASPIVTQPQVGNPFIAPAAPASVDLTPPGERPKKKRPSIARSTTSDKVVTKWACAEFKAYLVVAEPYAEGQDLLDMVMEAWERANERVRPNLNPFPFNDEVHLPIVCLQSVTIIPLIHFQIIARGAQIRGHLRDIITPLII
jgi:hypothetical protein